MLKNIKLGLFLAVRTLWRGDKGSLILTVLIMSVVFLNLLFMDSIFAGIGKTMDSGKINYQYGEVIIEPKDGDQYIKNAPDLINKIKDFYYVKSVTARIGSGAVLESDKNNDGRDVATFSAGVIGIDPSVDNKSIDIKSHLISGRYLQKGDMGKAMIGADLAGGYGSSVFPTDLEGVRVGDKVTAKFNNGIKRDYKIVGIYKTKNFDTDSKLFVWDRVLNSVLGTTNEATEVVVRLTDKNLSQKAIADFKKATPEKYVFADWNDKLAFGRSINKSFDMIGNILKIISSLVAGLVIFIIIFVDIVNRRKQIGILKAIGIPEKSVRYSYIFRGVFYTVLGIFFGYAVMTGVVINWFNFHPINFPMGDMVPLVKKESLKMAVILFSLAGFIGSWVPSLREVRKKILVLMR